MMLCFPFTKRSTPCTHLKRKQAVFHLEVKITLLSLDDFTAPDNYYTTSFKTFILKIEVFSQRFKFRLTIFQKNADNILKTFSFAFFSIIFTFYYNLLIFFFLFSSYLWYFTTFLGFWHLSVALSFLTRQSSNKWFGASQQKPSVEKTRAVLRWKGRWRQWTWYSCSRRSEKGWFGLLVGFPN
uniref:Uncharacterized protein n=1 Tax=Strigamia maritima TaxID=126957 RepID=T1JH89_STRMM